MCNCKTISFTIPLEDKALQETARMLERMMSVAPTPWVLPPLSGDEVEKAVETIGPGPIVYVPPVPAGAPVLPLTPPEYFPPTTPPPPVPTIEVPGVSGGVPVMSIIPTSTGVELDVRGLPWDRRIHSSSHNKCKNGEWKVARNTDPELVKKVEAELKAAMTAPLPTSTPVDPSLFAPPTPVPPAPVINGPVIDAPPLTMINPPVPSGEQLTATMIANAPPFVPDPVPSEDVPPVPVATNCPATFPEFLKVVTSKCSVDKTLAYSEVVATCQKYGLEGLPLVGSARPELMARIFNDLEVIWTTRTAA